MKRYLIIIAFIALGAFLSGVTYINGVEHFQSARISETGSSLNLIGPVTLDSAATNHSVTAAGDIRVRKLEVNNAAYFDQTAAMMDGVSLFFGDGGDVAIKWDYVNQTNDALLAGTSGSRTFIICEKEDMGVNFANSQQPNPTLIFQNSDAKSIYGRGTISHDNDDFTFQSHRGGFNFEVLAQYAQGTMTLTGIPSADETFIINATTITAKADGSGNIDHFTIGANATETVANIVSTIAECSEAANVKAWASGDTVVFEWKTAGTAGNFIVFTEAMSNCTIDGGGTLGGTHEGVAAGVPLILGEGLGAIFSGTLKAADYYSGDGTQGATDNTSFWMCTAADCSSKCQVTIKDGLITSCS